MFSFGLADSAKHTYFIVGSPSDLRRCRTACKNHAYRGLYELTSAIDYDRSRFDNMCRLSNFILNIYGYQHTYEESRWLAIRVLSPLVVLHDCEVTSAEEIGFLTGIPIPAAQARLERLREITSKGLFKNNFFERKVSESFGGFCARYTSVK